MFSDGNDRIVSIVLSIGYYLKVVDVGGQGDHINVGVSNILDDDIW